MKNRLRHTVSTRLMSAVAGLLAVVFIAWPIGSMLIKSFEDTTPATFAELREITASALALLAEEEQQQLLTGWMASASPKDRMEAIAAAFTLHQLPVPWDRKALYEEQIARAEEALIQLDPALQEAVQADLPIAVTMLHRRIPLAFKVKDQLGQQEFDNLRSGKYPHYSLRQYRAVLEDPRIRRAAVNSLQLAAIVTPITTLLAFMIAYGINKGIWGANWARYGILIPLVAPPVVIATAAILLFGRNGVINKTLLDMQWGWIDAGVTNLYGFWGVVLAQVLSYLPPAFIVIDNILKKGDGQLEEAAMIQGASYRQAFWNVTMPMSQPGLIRASILVFIFSMTDFGNPMVIGKDMTVMAGILYDEMIGFHNTPLASALAVWLIVPALLVYALLSFIGRGKRYVSSGGQSSCIALPYSGKMALSCITYGVIAFTVLIYATIVAGAFVTVWGQDFSLTLKHFTSSQTITGFVSEFRGVEPVWTSVLVAFVAAPLGSILATVIAYLCERVGGRVNNFISLVVLLPAILPGVIFGVGYIVAFNNPFGIASFSLNGTYTILILNILFGNLFVGVLAGRAMLRRLDPEMDNAAEILGAGLLHRFIHVTLPMIRHAVLLGMLYIFVDGLCTFSSVVFLQGPNIDLASVAIFQEASSSYYGQACAMSVTILLIVSLALAVMFQYNLKRDRMQKSWSS